MKPAPRAIRHGFRLKQAALFGAAGAVQMAFAVPGAQAQTESFQPGLSNVLVTHTQGIGPNSDIFNGPFLTLDIPGTVPNPPVSGTATIPILNYTQLSAATTTFQFSNTFNASPPGNPQSSKAFASIGESDSFTNGVGADLGVGTGITQSNPGNAYPFGSELTIDYLHLAYYLNGASKNHPFPGAGTFPGLTYAYPIGGVLAPSSSFSFGASLSFYFYPTDNPNGFSFSSPSSPGTLLTVLSLTKTESNNTNNASTFSDFFSGSLPFFYGTNGEKIQTSGLVDIEGDITFTVSPNAQVQITDPSMGSLSPGNGDLFDATGSLDLTQTASWRDRTRSLSALPGNKDVAEFANNIINKFTNFNLNAETTWAGLTVIDPGFSMAILSGTGQHVLFLGGLGVNVGPDPNIAGSTSNDVTLGAPVRLTSSQIWSVRSQNLSLVGGLSLGANTLEIQGTGGVYVDSLIASDNTLGGVQIDSGFVSFSGTNTYTGRTDLNGGQLEIASNINLGGANAPLNFNGGLLAITGTSLPSFTTRPVNWPTFTGGFNIENPAATFTISQNIGGGATDGGSLLKTGSGTLQLTGNNTYSGTTIVNGGVLDFHDGTETLPNANFSGAGGLTSFTGATVNAANFTIDFNNGSVNLISSPLTVSGAESIGDTGVASLFQSGNLNKLTSSNNGLFLGKNLSGTGTYKLTGGTLQSAGFEVIGLNGRGILTQTGGTNTIGSILAIGDAVTGNGTYILSGNATLSVAADEDIGYQGNGIFTQTGGINSVSGAGALNIAHELNSSGIYKISGKSTLDAPAINVGGSASSAGGAGTFDVEGGKITVAGRLQVWGNNGIVKLNANTTTVGSLTIASGGVVDINATLAINYGSALNDPVTAIAGYLTTGYNGNTWTGFGIKSTNAATNPTLLSVGYADGKSDPGTAAGPNQIIVKYTLSGDANLDGLVNFGDLVAVIQNFNKSGTDWAHGNYAYGPSTNFADLVTVIQNFNKTLIPAGSSADQLGGGSMPLTAGTTIPLIQSTDAQLPEPTHSALALASAAALLARRKRTRKPHLRLSYS